MSPCLPPSSCFGCRSVFPAAHVLRRVDGDRTPLCPRCGLDSVLDGPRSPEDLDREHPLALGPVRLLAEALEAVGLTLRGSAPALLADLGDLEREPSAELLTVGEPERRFLVDPPVAGRSEWRCRELEERGPGWRVVRSRVAPPARRCAEAIAGLLGGGPATDPGC